MGKVLVPTIADFTKHVEHKCKADCVFCTYDEDAIELEKIRDLHGRMANTYFRRNKNVRCK